MRPHPGYRIITTIACAVLFAAFILFLLVSLSLTIIRPIYLLTFRDAKISGTPLTIAKQLRFGVWGVCAVGDLFPDEPLCFGPQLGYAVPAYLAEVVQVSQTVLDTVQKALLVVLVLHPVVAGLALLNLFFSIMLAIFSTTQALAVINLVIAVITAIFASVSMGIDIALILVARSKLKDLDQFSFAVDFGNAVWIVVAGVALNWTAVVLLSARACYCLGINR